jgi:Fic family protein
MSFDPTRPFDLPKLPPGRFPEKSSIFDQLLNATRELAELKGLTLAMKNPMLVMSPAVIQESVASSGIEAIHSTVLEALQGELFPVAEQREPDKEILRYRDAMYWGFEHVKKLGLTRRLIIGIEHQLIPNSPAEYRRLQNGIKNTISGETVYTPPAVNQVENLMSNWERFVHADHHGMDPILRALVAHYQFEAIHPFGDGNGRTGRILLVLQLVHDGLLSFPNLFVSGYLNRNKQDYYSVLSGVTINGNWQAYLSFMLTAFRTQAALTTTTILKIQQEYRRFQERGRKALGPTGNAITDHLFAYPVTTPVRMGKSLDMHYTTASKHLTRLLKENLLRDKRLGRNRFFYNEALLKLLII